MPRDAATSAALRAGLPAPPRASLVLLVRRGPPAGAGSTVVPIRARRYVGCWVEMRWVRKKEQNVISRKIDAYGMFPFPRFRLYRYVCSGFIDLACPWSSWLNSTLQFKFIIKLILSLLDNSVSYVQPKTSDCTTVCCSGLLSRFTCF